MINDKDRPTAGASKDRVFGVAVLVAVVVLVAAWAIVPWQWSPVDDPGQYLAMRELISTNGPIGAVAQRVGTLAAGDWYGGIFRPLAWIYPPLLYWMPATAAHVVRLLMLIAVVVGPLVYFRRNGASGLRLWMILILLLASVTTLSQGLLLLSIQEVGGAMFVALGLLVQRKPLRLAYWVLAAWFKGPFSWILIGYAVALWREGNRRLALTSGAFGVGTLLVNVWWSRNGTYAGRYRIDPFDPELWKSAANILEPQNVVLAVIVLWWLVATQTPLQRRTDFPIFAIAAVGYYAQMIPWGFTAYYIGPITYLFGLLLASMLTTPSRQPLWQQVASIAGPAFITAWLLTDAMRFVLGTNAVIADATSCLSQARDSRSVIFGNVLYLTSSPEGPLRLEQNVKISNPDWAGSIATESNNVNVFLDPATTSAIVLAGAPLPSGREASLACSSGHVDLLQLGSSSKG